MTLAVDDQCTLTLTTDGANNYVPALWSAATTYTQLKACPATASKNFDSVTSISDANVGALLAEAIWGSATPTAAPAVVSAAGTLTVTADGVTMIFRPVSRTGASTVRCSFFILFLSIINSLTSPNSTTSRPASSIPLVLLAVVLATLSALPLPMVAMLAVAQSRSLATLLPMSALFADPVLLPLLDPALAQMLLPVKPLAMSVPPLPPMVLLLAALVLMPLLALVIAVPALPERTFLFVFFISFSTWLA